MFLKRKYIVSIFILVIILLFSSFIMSFAGEKYYILASGAKVCINKKDKIITGIQPGSTQKNIVDQFIASDGVNIKIYNDDKELQSSDKVGTGMKFKVEKNSTVVEEYTIVIYGDINGDGQISMSDITAIIKHIVRKNILTNEKLVSANSNRDTSEEVNMSDITTIIKHIVGKCKIDQSDIVDNEAPLLNSINVITPTEGTYSSGEEITIVAEYSENIKGIAPKLMLKFGSLVGKGTMTKGIISGNKITYTYTISEEDEGELGIDSYVITDLTDDFENLCVLTTTPIIQGNLITAKTIKIIITGINVNVRTGHGTGYEKIGVAYQEEEYVYIAEEKDVNGTKWYKIKFGDQIGWVTSQYSKKNLPIPLSSDKKINEIAEKYGATGVQVAVIDNGMVTNTYNYGWAQIDEVEMTSDTNIRVASISKVIIGMTAMKMQEQGILNIDEDISEYWGFEVKNPNYATVPITLKSILSHTSSIKDCSYDIIAADRLKDSSTFRNVKPGISSSFSYCNFAIGVGGSTLEVASNQSVFNYSKNNLFDPLGIDASFASGRIKNKKYATIYDSEGPIITPEIQANKIASDVIGANTQYFAGGLTITASDLAKLIAVLANDGVYNGTRILSKESVALMETAQFTKSEYGGTFDQCLPLRHMNNLYGQDELYYHTGNAYSVLSLASYNPNTKDGVIVVTIKAKNTRDSNGIYAICGEITEYVYENIL